MSIVKRTAELLGCELEVSSTVGEGSVFSVSVPRGDEHRLAESVNEAPQRVVNGARIMVVDDEPAVVDATRMFLEVCGFEVLSAASVGGALEIAEGRDLDMLIADYHLRGGETGLDVAHALRKQSRPGLPVIFVSGDTSDRIAAADLEQVTFLTKPVDAERLLGEIRQQLGNFKTVAE